MEVGLLGLYDWNDSHHVSLRANCLLRRHVFQDLRPYICTFDNCIDTANTLYGSRREWFEHELAFHRREWHCKECNFETSREEEIVQHLEKIHSDVYKNYVAAAMLKRCERPIQLPQECCICKKEVSSNQIRKHLAKHMQQLALFVLPTQEHDQSLEGNEQSDSDTNQLIYSDADSQASQLDRWLRPGSSIEGSVDKTIENTGNSTFAGPWFESFMQYTRYKLTLEGNSAGVDGPDLNNPSPNRDEPMMNATSYSPVPSLPSLPTDLDAMEEERELE